jgi:hypothetical protein
MDRIEYAVILADNQDGEPRFAARHIYPSFTAARRCAAAYLRDLGCAAAVANIAPPLEPVRSQDLWGVLEHADEAVGGLMRICDPWGAPALGPTLRTYASRAEARAAAAASGGYPMPAPIRQAMPVNRGPPQFA